MKYDDDLMEFSKKIESIESVEILSIGKSLELIKDLGDAQAVLESQRLAEEIVNAQKDEWIYESPDGGKTVFRRPAGDYDSKNKVEIDWETKEPTGRVFSDYNNGHWKGDEG